MRIKCEKCKEDISITIDNQFDKYYVGNPICPKCNKAQKRHINESDLLLYLGINEIFYLLATIFTSIIFKYLKISVWSIILILIVLILGFILVKNIGRYIYTKKDFKANVANEDKDKISRSMYWQSMLYLVLVVSSITLDAANNFFLIVSILAIVFTFIKFYLSSK